MNIFEPTPEQLAEMAGSIKVEPHVVPADAIREGDFICLTSGGGPFDFGTPLTVSIVSGAPTTQANGAIVVPLGGHPFGCVVFPPDRLLLIYRRATQ